MKIAIVADGPKLTSLLGKCFGKAKRINIVDGMSLEISIEVPESDKCTGPMLAQQLVDAGVKVVVTSHIGCTAYDKLFRGFVDVYEGTKGSTVEELAQAYSEKGLVKMTSSQSLDGDRCGGACGDCGSSCGSCEYKG